MSARRTSGRTLRSVPWTCASKERRQRGHVRVSSWTRHAKQTRCSTRASHGTTTTSWSLIGSWQTGHCRSPSTSRSMCFRSADKLSHDEYVARVRKGWSRMRNRPLATFARKLAVRCSSCRTVLSSTRPTLTSVCAGDAWTTCCPSTLASIGGSWRGRSEARTCGGEERSGCVETEAEKSAEAI